jgi:hypothetical protein
MVCSRRICTSNIQDYNREPIGVSRSRDSNSTLLSTRFQDTWRCVFKLKDFDPNKVQVRETKPAEIAAAAKVPKLVRSPVSIYEVHLDTTLEKEIIQVERDSIIESSAPFRHEKKGIKETWSGLTLHFTDKALADRVAKAFAHVIRLNGILLALACVSR